MNKSMSVINDLPVLILGYNRLDKFTRCIKTVQSQGIEKVYVSIDGPKNDYDYEIQKRIIDFCSNNNLGIDIKIKNLKKNYGCRVAPIEGISWFFKENKFGVILEDDVIVSKKCMELFSYLLEEHFSNKNLMSISSFNEFTNKEIESIYEIPVFRSWGWASWAERWEMHLDFSKKIRNLSIWQIYNLLPKELRLIETAELIKSSQLNLLDAWDYEFNFSHIVNKKKSLTIGGINNYVYGFDDSATHTVSIENIGINFDLFCERKVDKTILQMERNKEISTMAKCGFSKTINKNILGLIKDIFKSKYYSLIFYLRLIKKIMYKNL
jgi:hypothetical protein